MKTILFLGGSETALQGLTEELKTKYQVVTCPTGYSDICTCLSKYHIDLIVFFQNTFATPDYSIYKGLETDYRYIPVLTICSTEDYAYYRNYCPEPQFSFLFRPIRASRLFEKCALILKDENSANENSDSVEAEASVVTAANYLTDSPAEKPAPASSRKRLRILAIDDSPLILRSFKKMLESRYEIRLSFSGEKGLEMLPAFHPDIIFLDYEMPGLNGMDVFTILKKHPQTAAIPVIFLTGVAEKDKILQVLLQHPAGYLLKPLEESKLLEAIENARKKLQN